VTFKTRFVVALATALCAILLPVAAADAAIITFSPDPLQGPAGSSRDVFITVANDSGVTAYLADLTVNQDDVTVGDFDTSSVDFDAFVVGFPDPGPTSYRIGTYQFAAGATVGSVDALTILYTLVFENQSMLEGRATLAATVVDRTPVPEPTTVGLVALGIAGVVSARRRRR
jgi:hypothetical protein